MCSGKVDAAIAQFPAQSVKISLIKGVRVDAPAVVNVLRRVVLEEELERIVLCLGMGPLRKLCKMLLFRAT